MFFEDEKFSLSSISKTRPYVRKLYFRNRFGSIRRIKLRNMKEFYRLEDVEKIQVMSLKTSNSLSSINIISCQDETNWILAEAGGGTVVIGGRSVVMICGARMSFQSNVGESMQFHVLERIEI